MDRLLTHIRPQSLLFEEQTNKSFEVLTPIMQKTSSINKVIYKDVYFDWT